MLNEFKAFIMKGNVLDLAVGIIIGAAFTAIVTSLVDDLIQPLIGLIIGGIDFSTPGAGWRCFVQRRQLHHCGDQVLVIARVVFLLVKAANAAMPKKAEAAGRPGWSVGQ